MHGVNRRIYQWPFVAPESQISACSENTPRARPWETNIRSLIKVSGNVPVSTPNAYDPPDVYNPKLDHRLGKLMAKAIVENGVDFAPNLARIRDSSEKYDLSSTTTVWEFHESSHCPWERMVFGFSWK
jgi:hypothetical protein